MLILSNPLLLPLLLESNVIRMKTLERGDEGGYGSAWDRVHLVMGVLHVYREAIILAGELPEESEQFRFLRTFGESYGICRFDFRQNLHK
jgi:hypothetical protein